MSGCAGCGVRGDNGLPRGCKNNGSCSTGGCGDKLDVYDWLQNVYYYEDVVRHPLVEVKFKGTRKEYFKNPFNIDLETGDCVVVESQTTGWDLGHISLSGELVKHQMKKYRIHEDSEQVKKVLRKATEADFEKYDEGKGLEYETMLQARRLANTLNLTMKISDVEYQGDRTKATFFYTAEGRVDFRELIKVLAREFKIKIEMRQIGLRQEAGRLGGIGSCGRELCCSTWLTDFHSVPTTAARYQNLFLNPLKLSGQCGRLKCCLNYELDVYVEALQEFPEENTILKTTKGTARVEKTDILKRIMWFRYMDAQDGTFYPVEIEQVKRIVEMNEEGVIPADLDQFQSKAEVPVKEVEFKDTVGEESLDRFDRSGKGRRNKNTSQRQQQSSDRNSQKVVAPQPENERPNNRNQNPNQRGKQNQQNRTERPNQQNKPNPNNPNQNPNNRNPNPERQNPQNRQNKPNQQERPERQNRPERGNRPERANRAAQENQPEQENIKSGRPGIADILNAAANESSADRLNSDNPNVRTHDGERSSTPNPNQRNNQNRPNNNRNNNPNANPNRRPNPNQNPNNRNRPERNNEAGGQNGDTNPENKSENNNPQNRNQQEGRQQNQRRQNPRNNRPRPPRNDANNNANEAPKGDE
jgi:cell fate regulator YaaT (PSP1 superfamily)